MVDATAFVLHEGIGLTALRKATAGDPSREPVTNPHRERITRVPSRNPRAGHTV